MRRDVNANRGEASVGVGAVLEDFEAERAHHDDFVADGLPALHEGDVCVRGIGFRVWRRHWGLSWFRTEII